MANQAIHDRIDDLNNRKLEELYNQLSNELSELKMRRDLNRERVHELLRKLNYLHEEIARFRTQQQTGNN